MGNKGTSAFTLIEVVLAVGIFSFAIVGILGLFPLAMSSAQQSQMTTVATQIARTITSDLNAAEYSKASIDGCSLTMDLRQANVLTAATDANGEIVRQIPASEFQDGSRDPGHACLVEIRTIPEAARRFCKVIVSIEYPAAARKEARSRHQFITGIGEF